MSAGTANCPSCGAEIVFRWSGAVQTTCSYCDSILVRQDVDLEKVGRVSEPPPVTSPIQLGTEGSYDGRGFTVVGRIAYGWKRGGWSEWHIVFEDGRSGWLSDAQAEYAVTFLVPDPEHLPASGDMKPGSPFLHEGTYFEVTGVTEARYAGVEGELPFEYWDHEMVPFVDLRSEDGRLATLDYSDEEPLLFVGEYVGFEGLRLSGLREDADRTVDQVRTLNCPNCGGGVTIRHADLAVTVICESCGSVLDATTPGCDVVQTFEKRRRAHPLIPLGSTGRLRGHEYEVLGFQVRTIQVDGVPYSWREYLLYSRTQGYRYLSEYDNHWNDIITLKTIPRVKHGKAPSAWLHGEKFKHFQHSVAETTYVLGEFPWEIRVGDLATVDDYVSPPRLLSSEGTQNERTWSLGEYTSPEKIREAFDLPDALPKPRGVFANQPSPVKNVRKTMRTFAALAAILVVFFMVRTTLPNSRRVLSEAHAYDARSPDSSVVVIGPFDLDGRPSNLEVGIETNLDNAWGYFTFSLLDVETGRTFDFGREVSYYHGREGGESWSEGSRNERPRIPAVEAGQYMLRIVPEGPTNMQYRVTLRRDVPQGWHFLFALAVIAFPAAFTGVRYAAFEGSRWQESDYSGEE